MPAEGVTIDTLQAMLDAFNRHDLETLIEFYADDAVFDGPRGVDPWGKRFTGKDQLRAAIAERFADIPDVQYRDVTHLACGNIGIPTWTLTGTRRDGTPLKLRGCDHMEFRDGKVVRKDTYWKIVDA